MNGFIVYRRSAAGLLGLLLVLGLGVPALAVDLSAQKTSFDVDTYRSENGRHKILVESARSDQLKNTQTIRNHDYGSFKILEVDKTTADRLISSGIGSNADINNLLLLNNGAIDTTSLASATGNQKALDAINVNGGKRLHLVQFPGPIKPEWMTELEATGVQIVNAIPSNAYLVYGDASSLSRVAALAAYGTAQWQGAYLPEYKLLSGAAQMADQNDLKSSRKTLASDARNLFSVQLVRAPATNATTEALIKASSGKRAPVSRYEILSYVNLVVEVPPSLLTELAAQPDVVSIAPYVEPVQHDERQNMIVAGNLTGNVPNAGNYLTTLANWGFTQEQFNTSGFVVDVTDDGADRNPLGAEPGTISQDANDGPLAPRHFSLYEGGALTGESRFRYKGRWGTASTTDGGLGKGGHGQHIMSVIGGYVPDSFDPLNTRVHRDAQGFRFGLGVAPFVRLGNSVMLDPRYTNPNLPDMLSDGYANNARISNNSWGSDVSGAYNAQAQTYDALVRDSQASVAGNQQMVIVFAAGNAGPNINTVGSPASAKNVISVGAAENVHSHSAANGGNAGNTTGADRCAVTDTGADNASDIAALSSRGPTADGRKKPDLVAPGTHITGISFVAIGADPISPPNNLGAGDASFRASTICAMPGSGVAGNANNFFPVTSAQQWYTTSSGTSFSAPAVSGSAALVYQQFLNNPNYIGAHRTPVGSSAPSPALVKAYLTNSARYMAGVGANDALPSNNQGMGSVNLGTAFDGVQRIIRDQVAADSFTASGQARTFFATVVSATAPLRVSLAYTDAPGPTMGSAFVNNLDLRVTVNGLTYLGNVFSGSASVSGGVADIRNNLESVFLPAGLAVGTVVTVQVRAFNIAGPADPTITGNNQDFALVMYNAAPTVAQAALALASTALPTGNGVIEANQCSDVNLTLTNEGTNGATAISASLTSSSPGVTVVQGDSNYANISAGAAAANLTTFRISTAPSVVCGSTVSLLQTVSYTGGVSPITFPVNFQVGVPAVAFSQNFDSVTAPNLPAGWTTTQTGATPPAGWATAATGADSAPNTAFTDGSTSVASSSLVSPAIVLPALSANAILSFRHAWDFESNLASAFDGGVLELSTDGGTTYENVTHPAVGGTFTEGGYNTAITTTAGNPLTGQRVWGKLQASFVTSTLVLPLSLNGQTIRLRWRAGWDDAGANANPNWRIDSVSLIAGFACTAGAGVCAATARPPILAYSPTANSTVMATGGTTVGTSGALAITPSIATAGSGTGAAATTTLTCTAPSAPFSGFGQTLSALGSGAISGGPLAGSCTLGANVQTQTLSCTENRGGTNVPVSWTLRCPVGCSLDINGDGAVTADKDGVLLSRYLLGFRGAGLIAQVALGAGRADAQAVEAFIGTAAQFDVFGRAVPAATATQDSLVLIRLMLSVPDTALLGGITLPTGALFTSGSAVRANVNARCGTTY